MNQCVPCWDLGDPISTNLNLPLVARQHQGGATPVPVVPMGEFDVTELTWENGHVSSHGLAKPVPKYPPLPLGWNKSDQNCTGDSETLEAVVSEGTRSHLVQPVPVPVASPAGFGALTWLGVGMARSAAATAVPSSATDEAEAAALARRKRARVVGEDGLVCASQGSAAPGRGESTVLTLEACGGGGGAGADDLCGFTTTTNNSTSLSAPLDPEDKGSPETENTSIGGGANDSLCHSRRSQRDGVCEEGENVVVKGEAVRSSISTKRSRAAAIHNESERKRRDRINQKMKTLQKLVPNSSKTDKASMLDEAIEYLKQLQAQVQVMSRMSSLMMPMAMPQLQMSMMANMAQMAQMAQMGMGLGIINMGSLAQPSYAGLAPPLLHPSPFVPLATPPWDAAAAAAADCAQKPAPSTAPEPFAAFLASQAAQNAQQPTSMEAYNRMVALYQTHNQQNKPSSSRQ